jgi:hypothetical protein
MAKRNLNEPPLKMNVSRIWELYLMYLNHGVDDETALKNAARSLSYFDSAPFDDETETEIQ